MKSIKSILKKSKKEKNIVDLFVAPAWYIDRHVQVIVEYAEIVFRFLTTTVDLLEIVSGKGIIVFSSLFLSLPW